MSIFKDTFSPEIQQQLKIRGDAFLKRTPTDIIYINGRAAWVRATSGVDINGNSDIAKQNILQGGVLNDKLNLRQGIGNSFNSNAYSNTTLDNSNLYGLRPMPGITNIDIQSKSAYGSIRVANVTFKCWDIKQLELFELLYMRPGFLVLLEWGWLPYLDNNNVLQNNIEFYDIFNKRTKTSLQDHLKEVYLQSKRTSANYEGILGYIKNYEWSVRPDGGYDCRTEIISTGEILESLKVNYSTNFISTNNLSKGILFSDLKLTKGGQEYPAVSSQYTKGMTYLYENNIIAGVAGELIFYAYSKSTGKVSEEGNAWSLVDTTGELTGTKGHTLQFFAIDIDNESDSNKEADKLTQLELDKQIYIDLDSFTKLLSKWVIPADKANKAPLVPITTKNRTYYKENEVEEDLLCLSHPLQISVDPTVCLIKNTNFRNVVNIKTSPLSVSDIFPISTAKTADEGYLISYAKSTINFYAKSDTFDNVSLSGGHFSNYINEAIKRNIPPSIYGNILANAWEEYKIKNTPVQPTEEIRGNQSSVSKSYTITAKGDTNKFLINIGYDNNPSSKQAAVERISSISLLDVLRENLKEQGTYAVLSYKLPDNLKSQIDKIFSPSNNIKENAKNIIKSNIRIFDLNNQEINTESLIFLDKLNKEYFTKTDNGIFGNIGAIYVNLNNIVYLSMDGGLEANDVKEKREINLYDFLKKLMSQIQGSIGSLNNFEIHADPIDGKGRIIDINYIDDKTAQEAYDLSFTFNSTNPTDSNPQFNGLVNNVRNYKITSQIFKEQSSIVAISAQNGGGITGLDNETLVGFNKGITNRLLPDIGPPAADLSYNESTGQLKLVETLSSSLNSLTQFMKDLGWMKGFSWISQREFNIDNSDKYKNALRDMIMTYKALTKSDASFKAIIPTTLSLELDGIGGLVIGHIFRMPNELLPIGYKGGVIGDKQIGRKLGYIITKLGHRLSDSDWVTTVDAQTIILEESDKPNFDLEKALEAAAAGAKVEISAEGEIKIDDSKVKVDFTDDPISNYWTLVAICAAENIKDNLQGMADVAQSIYNRVNANGLYGGTLKRIITAEGQYEPVFKNKNDWKSIKNEDTAIIALKNSKNESQEIAKEWINNAVKALKDPTLKSNAAKFIGSRTEFLASTPKDKNTDAVGIIERIPKRDNNVFFWNYSGKNIYYNKNRLIATNPPSNINKFLI